MDSIYFEKHDGIYFMISVTVVAMVIIPFTKKLSFFRKNINGNRYALI